MSKFVAILDYQMGNLFSVEQAFHTMDLDAKITSDPKVIEKADGIVLPGVGAFGEAMEHLTSQGLDTLLCSLANQGKPIMGVCLGMHLLFTSSDEFGETQGLNLIPGKVKRFSQEGDFKVPHVGWSGLIEPRPSRWKGTPVEHFNDKSLSYFIHSYYAEPESEEVILTETEYAGHKFCSSVLYRNIFATQFHPEKSAEEGLEIYKNWVKQF